MKAQTPAKNIAKKTSKKTVKPTLSSKLTAQAAKLRTMSWWRPVVAIVVIAGIIAIAMAAAGNDASKTAADANKEQLQAQVDNQDGTPRSGRDPASQNQNSLASAASRPTGTEPSSNTPGGERTDTKPSDVIPDSDDKGLNASGCYVDYGKPGEQCLPAHTADADGNLTCTGVRKHFPQGIQVTGQDRYHLDSNGNKTACDSGDAADSGHSHH